VAGAEFGVVEGCVCRRENLDVEWSYGCIELSDGSLTEGKGSVCQDSEYMGAHDELKDFISQLARPIRAPVPSSRGIKCSLRRRKNWKKRR